jgi:DNA polymerase III epsilon subunit-like protein
MKYFIDFEATQYTQEIIQIGCVREDGQKFSSLIKPRHLKNVTRAITELTGIAKNDLAHERNSDEVFSELFDWICRDRTPAKFFCYGSSDLIFVKNNLKKCTKSIRAQAALSIIAESLTDVANLVEEHFRLEKVPSLKKVMGYYYPEDEHVCHDALSDAEMLYEVYQAMMNEEKIRGIPFPEYIGTPIFKSQEDLDRFVIVRSGNGKGEVVYKTLDKAKEFIIEQVRKHSCEINHTNAQKKILAAINNKKKYFGYEWTVRLKKVQ